jgi:hypothetical protein
MDIKDIIAGNSNFQSSVNIAFDFGSADKIKQLIPTESVLAEIENLLYDVMNKSTRRAKVLTGPYGKGKSHVVLVALSAMSIKNPDLYEGIYRAYLNENAGFAATFKEFVTSGRKLLPVIVSGSSSDLHRSLLGALKTALRFSGLENLMPSTNYNGAIDAIKTWARSYPDTLKQFEEAVGMSAENAIARLSGYSTEMYDEFVDLYPTLTSGSRFNSLENANVVEVFQEVAKAISEEGYSGIYVVYDEFSKYLEANIANTSVEDIKLLQDFAEACSRSALDKQLNVLLIGHKSMSNYIDSKLPKEKVDGWRGVSGRYFEVETIDDANESYELVSHAITKDEDSWAEWLSQPVHRAMLESVSYKYVEKGTFPSYLDDTITFGCFPLHPISTYLLPRLSEKVAQNERTLFTFLSSNDDRSLTGILATGEVTTFVSPDYIYDYFEPLFRAEYYTSPIHQIYELAKSSLSKIDGDILGEKIIKFIALAYIVSEFDNVDPTKQTIISVYSDCGYSQDDILNAIDNLVEKDSIIYLRRSDARLQLKKCSGQDIEGDISDRAEKLKSSMSAVEILNREQSELAIYPSRHNQENAITRYFECRFITLGELNRFLSAGMRIPRSGDGIIAAVVPDKPDDVQSASDAAERYTLNDALSVLSVEKNYREISDTAFRLLAAKQLAEEADEDETLRDEYELVFDDCEQLINEYVAGSFRPELKLSRFFSDGRIKRVHRRAQLSELLSTMCDEQFPYTPYINNEAINKNALTGQAKHSRSRILHALCSSRIEPNLGFVGSGQETSMMRSVLVATGLIEQIDSCPHVNLRSDSEGIRYAISRIEQIIDSDEKVNIGSIYEALSGYDSKIGMKRGPIIVLLALVLRDRSNEVQIESQGIERQLTGDLLDDIDAKPNNYDIRAIDWNPSYDEYLSKLDILFNARDHSKSELIASMKRWYVELPQVVRNAKTRRGFESIGNTAFMQHRKFLKALRSEAASSQKLLFQDVPSVFSKKIEDDGLIESIKKEKAFCESYVVQLKKALVAETKKLLVSNAPAEASLQSVCIDWTEQHRSHKPFANGVERLIDVAITNASADDMATISRIAKACTSLRIEDWNDGRIEDYYRALNGYISFFHEADQNRDEKNSVFGITYLDDGNNMKEKTFVPVECSPRARLLKNEIVNSLNEMGQSISDDEKRQVVFEVLRELL